jgi:hypothetical protein
VDRLRFHYQHDIAGSVDHPLTQLVRANDPHLLIRRLDRDEELFVSIDVSVEGEIAVLSNDTEFARAQLRGIFVECPPSFHTLEEFEVTEEWSSDEEVKALFVGLLVGALGWDPSHNVPENIRQSLDEARRSLDIANYRSCVAMSRRTIEGVLKFGYERLLKQRAVNSKGLALTLNDIIREFRSRRPAVIPDHLLYVADSIRLIGNVPGAHASDIANYHFSRSDAEFALYATVHFLEQYFSKIDKEVAQYYTATMDLAEDPHDARNKSD